MKHKGKPRVGETITSLANAINAISELLTRACDMHGGEWEGGRLKLSYEDCNRKCINSMMRHFIAEATGELIDRGEGGLGMHHDIAIAANALIRVERRLRDEAGSAHH